MLHSIKTIHNYVLKAEDGEIGRCKDLLFDDNFWAVRYMMADTGKWLPGRQVLLSPISLGKPDSESKTFQVRLTKKQIEEAPGIDADAPVSRKHEILWMQYYNCPYYWSGPYVWGPVGYPGMLTDEKVIEHNNNNIENNNEEESEDNHLRSVHEVTGYHIQTKDDEVGHVVDFIVDDETWIIRYIVVDTRNWLPGKKVLIPPTWIDSVDWATNKVIVNMTRKEIKDCPEYDPSTLINREYEERLYNFHDRLKYWE